jgi:hypothetical protein
LVPYKLHCQQTVENAIEATNTENFPNNCENSTVHKIKKWFSKRTKLFYLGLIKRRNTKPIPNEPKLDPEEKFFRMKGWLKKTVWDLINHGLWFATRSEFPFELA